MPPLRPLGAAWLAAALLTLAPAVPAGAVTPNGRLQIIHLDVGQGDGAVIISPLGQVALIDEGPSGVTPANGVTVVNQLKALGVTYVDYHFASHYHSDHIGNIAAIVSGGIPIGYGWDRGGSYSTGAYTTYVNTLGSKRRTMVKNQVVLLDSLAAHPVIIKCVDLAGAGIPTSDENSLAMVLKITYGEFDETFGGDLPGANSGSYVNVETTVGPEAGPVEVYKVHHHGSATSSLTAWLGATAPKIGVISEGNGNSYGHPTASALTRLHNAGVHTYWTETGTGVAPNPSWDKVSNNQVIISATWQPGGVDTVRGSGFADTFTNSGSGDVTPPAVAVGAPNGGEDWKAGSTHAITWTATDNVGVSSVDLAYSTNGGATFPYAIATGVANSGSYSWTVPNTPSSGAVVRVTAHDAAGNTGSDTGNASFTIGTWTIAASAGAGGSISPSGSVPVVQGADQSFTLMPATGYCVAGVLVDGASAGAVGSYTFTNVTTSHTIGASFALNTYTLAITVVGSGSVARNPDQPAYDHGTLVTLTAVPAAGYSFAAWDGDAHGAGNPLAVTMDGGKGVIATFAPQVALLAPSGSEIVQIGSALEVRWVVADGVSATAVDVLLSRQGSGGPYDTLAAGLPNTSSYQWIVAGPETNDGYVKVVVHDGYGSSGADVSKAAIAIRGVLSAADAPVTAFALEPAWPNPAQRAAWIRFAVPREAHVRLSVLDVQGREVALIADGVQVAGRHAVEWNGRSGGGAPPPGLYLVRLVTPGGTFVRRLALVR